MLLAPLPDTSVMPSIIRYKIPDTKQTMVSSWTCSDKVITVANYNNQSNYYDVDNIIRICPDLPVGEIGNNSSLGPTRDGRQKPNISATGNCIMAPGRFATIASFLGTANSVKVSHDTLHNRVGGTSMTSPIVAGIVALQLQKEPTSTYKVIKDAIMLSAIKDTFTGPVNNNTWGFGKINGFGLLNTQIVYACMDTNSFNYDSTANINTNCIPIVLGCIDTSALNFDTLANVFDSSCFYIGINKFDEKAISLYSYPNPFTDETTIYYSTSENKNLQLIVYDIIGRPMKQLKLPKANGRITLNSMHLSKGTYFYSLVSDWKVLKTKQLLVY